MRRKVRPVAEIKRSESLMLNHAVGSTGLIVPFPTPAPGDSAWERDGRAIKVLGFQNCFTARASVDAPYCGLRIIYFLWKQVSVTPTVSMILKGIAYHGTYSIDNSTNYEIIWDQYIELNPGSNYTTLNGFNGAQKSFNHKFNYEMMQSFLTGSDTPSDRRLYCLAVADYPGTNVNGNCAVSFIDV